MNLSRVGGGGVLMAAILCGHASASAQSIGTFTWQLQPFCNRVTVNVTQNGAVYTLDGFDDQCGAPQRAPLVGLATPNPDGTIGFGIHIATSPGGKTVSVEARVSLGTIGGPWTDSSGNSGTLVLNGNAAGAARPAPTGGPSWGTAVVGPSGLTGEQQGLSVTMPAPAGAYGGALVGTWGSDPPPVDDSAGVIGRSQSATGVTGISVRNNGVLGVSTSFIGVQGFSSTNRGVSGRSDTGIGVFAAANSGTALALAGGPIKVSGDPARRPVFLHTTTAGNTTAHVSTLDHPLLNGIADAAVFVTHTFVPGATVLNPHPLSVWYDTAIGRWRIFNSDSAAMPLGMRVAVLVFHTGP